MYSKGAYINIFSAIFLTQSWFLRCLFALILQVIAFIQLSRTWPYLSPVVINYLCKNCSKTPPWLWKRLVLVTSCTFISAWIPTLRSIPKWAHNYVSALACSSCCGLHTSLLLRHHCVISLSHRVRDQNNPFCLLKHAGRMHACVFVYLRTCEQGCARSCLRRVYAEQMERYIIVTDSSVFVVSR